SRDGLAWDLRGPALAPTPGTWDSRGTRVTDVIRRDGRWWCLYDGRASAGENWRERTGIAVGDRPDELVAIAGAEPVEPGPALRYASTVESDDGDLVYFEHTSPDGAHDLRVVYIPRPSLVSQPE